MRVFPQTPSPAAPTVTEITTDMAWGITIINSETFQYHFYTKNRYALIGHPWALIADNEEYGRFTRHRWQLSGLLGGVVYNRTIRSLRMTGFAEVEPWRAHMDVLARKLDGLVEEHASLEADVKHAWMGC